MRHRAILALSGALMLTACNQLFDSGSTRPVDAALPIEASDFDLDGVPDLEDNCPDRANADQADGDGDVCDDCPLIANAQHEDFDVDGVGDACDPRPDMPGDCLVLFDTFSDPSRFADGWEVFSTNTTPLVDVEAANVYVNDTGLGVTASCRADFGFSVGVTVTTGCTRKDDGAPGVLTSGEDVTVQVIAILRTQPGEPCMTTWR